MRSKPEAGGNGASLTVCGLGVIGGAMLLLGLGGLVFKCRLGARRVGKDRIPVTLVPLSRTGFLSPVKDAKKPA